MDIIVYLCGMNFSSQTRYNPKTGRDERYYRLKESYRNALGRSCTRILLNVGFVDDLLPEGDARHLACADLQVRASG